MDLSISSSLESLLNVVGSLVVSNLISEFNFFHFIYLSKNITGSLVKIIMTEELILTPKDNDLHMTYAIKSGH